jgi:hypothetical protein
MPEIGTSGSMSGDGKRGMAQIGLGLPRPSSTLPALLTSSSPSFRYSSVDTPVRRISQRRCLCRCMLSSPVSGLTEELGQP